jgi:hypothetical protein
VVIPVTARQRVSRNIMVVALSGGGSPVSTVKRAASAEPIWPAGLDRFCTQSHGGLDRAARIWADTTD